MKHDQLINIKCLPGFKLKGASAVRCYLGELSAVYVHNVHFIKNKMCTNCDVNKEEIIDWPICKPEMKDFKSNSYSNLKDWNLEKREIEFMIKDDLDELKKLNKTKVQRNSYRSSYCPKPTRLKSILKNIDKLKNANLLNSKLIGIVELDHNSKNSHLISSKRWNKLIYPPGSQILFHCIEDNSNFLFDNDVLVNNWTNNEKSNWLLTCRNGDWIGQKRPCPQKDIDLT